jgi:hypothetical protein
MCNARNGCRTVRRQDLKMKESTPSVEGMNQEEIRELTRNTWNYHAAAARLVRSVIVKVEDAD